MTRCSWNMNWLSPLCMLNKPGYFALSIIQNEGQKKGGNDRIWVSRMTFSSTHSSSWFEQRGTTYSVSNACGWKVSEKVGSLVNSNDHFFLLLFSVSGTVWHNWSLESFSPVISSIFIKYQSMLRYQIQERRTGKGWGKVVQKSRHQYLYSSVAAFFLSFQHGKGGCFYTKLFSYEHFIISNIFFTHFSTTANTCWCDWLI